MKILQFENLKIGRQRNGKDHVLLDLDSVRDEISFAPGVYLIVAPNGVGKSTFLQSLAGTLQPFSGSWNWSGVSPGATDALYVSEYLVFPKWIYPREWIEFLSGGTLTSETSHWLNRLLPASLHHTYLGRMSFGERRRVTWLGAHASPARLILMDEPFNGLDVLAFETVLELIEAWRKSGKHVFIVSHQLGDFFHHVDDLILFKGQHLIRASTQWKEWSSLQSRELRKRIVSFYST